MDQADDSSAIVVAINWIEQVLSGSAATVLTTMALASIGFLMLTGRIEIRRGASIVLGCFVIFGAASIARGLVAAAQGDMAAPMADIHSPPVSYPKAPAGKKQSPPDGSPYAGVAIPQR